VISDGKIVTKTETTQYGIGILEDNSAFMSKFTIYSTLYREDGTATRIHNINKLRQPYSIYMMTDDFGTQTYNTTKGIDVILTEIEGEMKLGNEITAVVESVNEYEGSIAIPEGKMVITVDANAPEEYYQAISSINIGEKIKITFGVDGDQRWNDVKIGLGATGDVLIENNKVNTDFEAGANPRTAIGITNEGKIILYTIDGRQKGYSYGVQLKSLANRLKELGCKDAINLDGGGSTSYVVQLPGDDVVELINSPSDGKLRKVSNFIFLKNNQKPTGILSKITVYPLTSYVLVGESIKLTAKGADTAYYSAKTPNLKFSLDAKTTNTITQDGTFTANENGIATVYAKSGTVEGSTTITCIANPTNISVIKDQKQITSLTINREETASLSAEAFAGYNKLITSDKSFEWWCDKEIGTITKDGKFTATDSLVDTTGNIYVKAGGTTVEIPVTVKGLDIVYNTININVNETVLEVDVNISTGLPVNKEDIIIKADGKKIDFNYRNGLCAAIIPENTSKITVFVTNSRGYTSFSTTTVGENQYENPFTDTDEHWAKKILSYMYSAKIVSGETTEKGLKFNPGKSMTRSEFAVMITNYLGVDVNEYTDVTLPYDDLDNIPKWALNSFKALYNLGIVQGSNNYGKLYANPLDSITRAETATIISRTLPQGLEKAEITSSDKDDIADWAKNGFEILINLGAINGYEDGTILPLKNVTKAEAAKILYSIL
ncbi:MAG: phosphodiester glycosidase family protein, partial [Clostridia bacterium]|nr:phosphodiester glycosidase family protein [Clostridia bacterium]